MFIMTLVYSFIQYTNLFFNREYYDVLLALLVFSSRILRSAFLSVAAACRTIRRNTVMRSEDAHAQPSKMFLGHGTHGTCLPVLICPVGPR
jgi:hypothetical protein